MLEPCSGVHLLLHWGRVPAPRRVPAPQFVEIDELYWSCAVESVSFRRGLMHPHLEESPVLRFVEGDEQC